MSKHLFRALSTSLLALVLFACESNDIEGSLTVEKDLTLSSLSITNFSISPDFDSQNPGPYSVTVGTDVDEIEFVVGNPADTSGVNMRAFRRVTATTSNRDGLSDEQVVTAGEAFSFTLEPGDNLFAVRVQTDNEEQRLEYLISVHRVSDVAELLAVVFDDLTTENDEALRFTNPSEFDSGEFVYSLSAPFSRCSLAMSTFGADRYTKVEYEGEVLDRGEVRYIELAVGENVIEIDVTSEDESDQQTYTFTITRAEADSDDESEVDSLSDLSFGSGDLISSTGSEGFNCLLTTYVVRIDNDQETVTVSATPSIEGRVVELVDVITTEDDDGDSVITLENPEVIPAGGSLTLDISDDSDENRFAISLARDDDDNPKSDYSFVVVRSERNVISVATGEELQAALKNAVPNQEIVITAEGDLTAESILAASGKEGVVFFSDASGTADEPIVLRSTNSVTLSGTTLSDGTVLELNGDYWQVRNLNISTAAYGLVLDSASNNEIENVEVSEIGLRGVQFKNDSDNNSLIASDIHDVGSLAEVGAGFGEAVVVGSTASEWNAAPDSGNSATLAENNLLANLNLGPNVTGELVQVHAGALATRLFELTMDSRDLSDAADATAAAIISGNNTEFSYSSFLSASSANISSGVLVTDIDDAAVTEPWGEDTTFFDNYFQSTNTDLAILSADESVDTVNVDDNIRSDGEAPLFSGAAIDESLDSPLYTLEWVNPDHDETYCLQSELTTVQSTSAEVTLITAGTCDSSADQQWNFVADEEGYVLIRPSGSNDTRLAPVGDGVFRSNASTLLELEEEEGDDIDSASSSRWKAVYADAEHVYLSNKFAPAYGLTLVDLSEEETFATTNNVAYISVVSQSDRQLLKLVPVTSDP